MQVQFRTNLQEIPRAAGEFYRAHIRPILLRLVEAVSETVQRVLLAELRTFILALQAMLPTDTTVVA